MRVLMATVIGALTLSVPAGAPAQESPSPRVAYPPDVVASVVAESIVSYTESVQASEIVAYTAAVQAEEARVAEAARAAQEAAEAARRAVPVQRAPVAPQAAPAPSGGACGGATNGADQFIQRESGGNPQVFNPSGAYGCYQIMPGTWHGAGCDELGTYGNASPAQQAACASRLSLSAWNL